MAGHTRNLATRVGARNAAGFAQEQVGVIAGQRSRFAGLRDQFIGDVQNIGGEQQAFGAAVGSQAFQVLRDQGAGTSFGGSLSRGLQVSKARQGILNRGDAAIRGQRLKDRLTLARSGLRRQGAALDLQTAGQQIRSGVDIGVGRARDRARESTAGLIGTGLGAAAGVLNQNRLNTGSLFDFGVEGPGIFKPRGPGPLPGLVAPPDSRILSDTLPFGGP